MQKRIEAQWIGLPGPSHYYGGLGSGNQASQNSKGQVSYPKLAAQQSLKYMELLLSHEVPTLWYPPQPRPIPAQNFQSNRFSSSFMWTANMATIIPSWDSKDGRIMMIPANLNSNCHRRLEATITSEFLQHLSAHHLKVSPPSLLGGDEGAANHMRLGSLDSEGLHVFVHNHPEIGIGRQSKFASQDIIKQCQIKSSVLLEQNREAVTAGVFHNDVIAMSCMNYLIYHEKAFHFDAINTLLNEWKKSHQSELNVYCVNHDELSLDESIQNYFFNASWFEIENKRVIILPIECRDPKIQDLIERLIEKNFFNEVYYLDLKQSMRNGGGPACLRLRLPLQENEFHCFPKDLIVTHQKLDELKEWIENYPLELHYDELWNMRDDFYEIYKKMPHAKEFYPAYYSVESMTS